MFRHGISVNQDVMVPQSTVNIDSYLLCHCGCAVGSSLSPLFIAFFDSYRERIKRYRSPPHLLPLQPSMFSIRLALLLVLLVLTQADSNKNNYIRGEKVNPASRIVNGKHDTSHTKNDLLEFVTVTRLTGSKPVQDGAKFKKTQWP